MSYKHITLEERACIKKLKSEGSSIRAIATYLERSPSTISRELKRNKGRNGVYHPVTAQRLYFERKDNCGRKITINYDLQKYINDKIDENWSPEQIYFRSKLKNHELNVPSFSTIYRWIHLGLIAKGDMKKLRRKGKFKRPQETRGRFNIEKTIKKRPKSVYKREEIGHIRKSSYCLVTLVERKSRYTLSMVLPNRREVLVTPAIINMMSKLPSYMVKTITCNRGKEFSGYKKIESTLNCDVYFADPYCSWQRGTNENTNGLLREYYPKGMDLSLVTTSDLDDKTKRLDTRPRKCIKFYTPKEILFKERCCT